MISQTPARKRRIFSAPRAILLARTTASLSAAALIIAPGLNPSAGYQAAYAQNLSEQARKMQAPVGFADIVEKVKPAVISVRVKVSSGPQASGTSLDDDQIPPGLREFFRRFGMPDGQMPRGGRGGRGGQITGQGSGFFFSADGYAVTKNHTVDKADSVPDTNDDGTIHNAKVIGTDPRTDLALIKVEGGSFPYVKLSDHTPRIGDWVIAVGNPFGLGGTVTAGIVSARGRDIGASAYDDFIQIDAPVNKGNSGGPTFDTEGNVIGVNTAIFSPSGGSVGIAFAIPSDTVTSVVAQLKEHGSVTRGWIGVQIQPVTQDIAESLGLKKVEGALVAEPQPNSPAAKAGIAAGDVITAVNGKPIKGSRELAREVGMLPPGTSVKFDLLHDGTAKTVTLTLGEMPREQQANASDQHKPGQNEPHLGLALAPANEVSGAGADGVAVVGVEPGSPASDHGFKTGDVILQVGGKAVSSVKDVRSALDEAHAKGKHD